MIIIHGKSGSGKSALMAKAFEQAEKKLSKKVLYRFVGATGTSSNSKEVLTSLLTELANRKVREVKNKSIILGDNYSEETFQEFSEKVSKKSTMY